MCSFSTVMVSELAQWQNPAVTVFMLARHNKYSMPLFYTKETDYCAFKMKSSYQMYQITFWGS